MCNAKNHRDGCMCGWGGEGHAGRRYGSGESQTYELNNYLKLRELRRKFSYVNPNARCPVCGAPVYFYQSENGGRVFFDELGKPWPKHPCTDSNYTEIPMLFTEKINSRVYDSNYQPFIIEEVREHKNKDIYIITGTVGQKKIQILSYTGISEQDLCFISFNNKNNVTLNGYGDLGEHILHCKTREYGLKKGFGFLFDIEDNEFVTIKINPISSSKYDYEIDVLDRVTHNVYIQKFISIRCLHREIIKSIRGGNKALIKARAIYDVASDSYYFSEIKISNK